MKTKIYTAQLGSIVMLVFLINPKKIQVTNQSKGTQTFSSQVSTPQLKIICL